MKSPLARARELKKLNPELPDPDEIAYLIEEEGGWEKWMENEKERLEKEGWSEEMIQGKFVWAATIIEELAAEIEGSEG